ncbi:hypothetical protein [Ferrimicrobium sp.]|uniref:hypothetical protein n=1 Tax=Ferrimicrobium sp. TaxID=2926050 RepID=UPI0026186BDE|nr:hypothetical protein [Ferrimicrobium sp.]
MRIDDWNHILMEWFFAEGTKGRVYLRVDHAELALINDQRRLRLDDPDEDLVRAVRNEVRGESSLSWLRRRGEEWRAHRDPDEAPPWLAALAVSVLVVAQETERGSTRFYAPFAKALDLASDFTQGYYEESLYGWWVHLGEWLSDVNEGRRGQPSWRHIPRTGPRCVIGHPYTQVLLRHEDFQDIDNFLRSLGHFGPSDLEVTDPAMAGADLLDRLRRWAAQRNVSGRLWDILHGNRAESSDSLQYMLLDRLLDEVDTTRARSFEREARLVVTLDDWEDRRLRYSVIVPTSVGVGDSQTLEFDGQIVGPLWEGEPYLTQIPVDAFALNNGLSIVTGNDVTLVYTPRDVVALALRDWSIWCSADDVEAGETVYLLVAARATTRLHRLLEGFDIASIDGVPEGWKLYGPNTVTSVAELNVLGLPTRRASQSVPRLVGGLEVARSSYLVGAPPAVIVPSDYIGMPVRLDGDTFEVAVGDAPTLDLTDLNLGSGKHQIDLGPYRLTFELHTFDELPVVAETVGRTAFGTITLVDGDDSNPVFIGAARRPRVTYDPAVLTPLGERMVALGPPGREAECTAQMGAWAVDAGLPQLVFEPALSSSYPGGRRPVHPIRWMAVQEHPGFPWSVTQVQRTTDLEQERVEEGIPASSLAFDIVSKIGIAPIVLRDMRPDESVTGSQEWADYFRSLEGEP